jgi:hypothetical protein
LSIPSPLKIGGLFAFVFRSCDERLARRELGHCHALRMAVVSIK